MIVGGGEHARVVAEAASRSGQWQVDGFTTGPHEPPPPEGRWRDTSHGAPPWLGTDDAFAEALRDRPSTWLVLGFGGPADARTTASDRFGPQAHWATVIHPDASVAASASLAPGVVVLARAVVNPDARIGRHAIINSGVIVEHDVEVGPGAHLAPGSIIGGGARIGADAFVGLGAVVRDHVAVGPGAVVAMGAVVVDDVPPGATVAGLPARPMTRDGVTHA